MHALRSAKRTSMGLFKDPFGARKDVTESIDEYGPLSMPPSAEAGAILAAMSEEEKVNFSELLQHLQEELESHAKKDQSVKVHFEARTAFWGIAFFHHSTGKFSSA